jgi:predicted RNase H-like nuclease
VRCLGIDLAWSENPSGLCCLEFVDGKLVLLDLRRETTIVDIFAWVDRYCPDSGIVAVDAPTLIPNQTGSRIPDRLAHKYFGKYHAGCYPANLGLPFVDRTLGVGLSLEARGFEHAPTIEPRKLGKYQIEMFPHPAMIHLFGLNQILKYKKGAIAQRKLGLAQLRQYILEKLPNIEPRLEIETLPEIPNKGTELKALEDQLDSMICAYAAGYWWYWGLEKNLVLGDRESGYIVVPSVV